MSKIELNGWEIIDERAAPVIDPIALLTGSAWALDSSDDDFEPIGYQAEESITDGANKVYRVQVGGAWAYVHCGEYDNTITLRDSKGTFAEYLSDWDYSDTEGGLPGLLASFGLDADSVLDEADEDYNDTCRVWVCYNYFSGTLGRPLDHFARDEQHDEIVFDDYASAAEWIEEQEDSAYYCGNGEAGRPAYTICKA